MKKALPLLAILLVLAGAIVFTRRRAGGVGERFPASRAAELAPAETVAFLQLPDLERSRERWKGNELGAILNEEKEPRGGWHDPLRDWAQDNFEVVAPNEGAQEMTELFMILAEMETVDSTGLFLAAIPQDRAALPKLIGGLPFRAKKMAVEAAVRDAKERLLHRWVGAKSELSTHRGIEIESIASPTAFFTLASPLAPGPFPSVHLAFRDEWLFFATDRALLEGTLDRYLRRPEAGRSLAQDAVFAECRKHGSADADLMAWVRWDPLGKVMAQRLLRWSLPDEKKAGNPLQAVLYSCALAGRQSRDRLYFHLTEAPTAPPLANHSLALTAPKTHVCAAINFDGVLGQGDWLRQQFWSWGKWSRYAFISQWTEADLDDVRQAFGPELDLCLEAEDDGDPPEWLAALEVRDAVIARRLVDKIAEEQEAPAPTVQGDATRWEWEPNSRNAFLSPMVLTKTQLLFGAPRLATRAKENQLETRGPTLQTSAAYIAAPRPAEAAAGPPNGMLLYFDTPAYLACSRDRVAFVLRKEFRTAEIGQRPKLALQKGLRSNLASRPALWDSIGPGLQPGTVSLRTEGPGWLAESTLGLVGNTLLILWLREP